MGRLGRPFWYQKTPTGLLEPADGKPAPPLHGVSLIHGQTHQL